MSQKIKIRLGISPCPNDTFIFGALALNLLDDCPFEFITTYADVQTLNERALSQDFDLLKVSFGLWVNIQSQVVLLNCGGAMGFGCGPLILSQANLKYDNSLDVDQPVWLPGKHTTAQVLFDFWCQKTQQKFEVKYAFFDEIYHKLQSKKILQAVAIHEGRFTYEKDGLKCIQDLGQFWEEQTASPIPLGGIILHPNLSMHQKDLEIWIRKSIHFAQEHFSDLEAYIQSKAQIFDPEVIQSHIKMFVNEFSLDWGDEGQRAIRVLSDVQTQMRQV